MSSIDKFIDKLPWLNHIPDNLLAGLCLEEFKLPDADGLTKIHELEQQLGCYLMPYGLDVFRQDLPAKHHLCANIGRAALPKDDLAIFVSFEAALRSQGISLAAYEKPIRIIVPARL